MSVWSGVVVDVVLFLLVAAVVWWAVHRIRVRPQTGRGPLAPPQRPAVRTRPRQAEAAATRTAAQPAGALFAYAGAAGEARGTSVHEHTGDFAVVDVETTGFSPASGDRMIELAVARVDRRGRILDEYATLLNPRGRDTGPVFVHGISNDAVADAPSFAEVLPELLSRVEDAVVVAHNAPFEERFLAAELASAGHGGLRLPALCTLWLGQRTFTTANHKLTTLAKHAGVQVPAAHAALGDVRTVAGLLPLMLDRAGGPLVYDCPPAAGLAAPAAVPVRPKTRAAQMRKGNDGWMACLLDRLPTSAAEAGDADAAAYTDALAEVLADGKIVGEEAKALAKLVGAAGMGAAQVAALNERFLESMREAAFADDVLTAAELRELTAAAKALGMPDYFDDLNPTAAPADSPAQTTAPSSPANATTESPAPMRRVRRCGHCRTPGHYRSTCPQLN